MGIRQHLGSDESIIVQRILSHVALDRQHILLVLDKNIVRCDSTPPCVHRCTCIDGAENKQIQFDSAERARAVVVT